MRKSTTFIISTVITLLTSSSVLAADFTTNGITYSTIDESTVSVKKYIEGDDVVIPSIVKDANEKEYTVVRILENSFKNANANSVKVPATVTIIDPCAFSQSKMTSIELSEGIKEIGYSAFNQCLGLTTITIPSTVTVLGFGDGFFEGSAFLECTNLKEVKILAPINEIPEQTFKKCTNLSTIELSEGLKTIGENAFNSCTSLNKITLPNGVTTIKRNAFSVCESLTEVVLPASTSNIASFAFYQAPNITDVYCHAPVPPTASGGTYDPSFDQTVFSSATLHVPAGTENAYKAAACWSRFISLEAITTGVDSIETEEGTFCVVAGGIEIEGRACIYGIDGRIAAATDGGFVALPAGIYIVRGSKIIVK